MPDKLYKYRRFDVRTLRSLTEAEIHYAQPRTFNDPMDCDPTIEVDVSRETLEKLYYRLLLRHETKDEASKAVGYLRYMSTEYGDFRTDRDVEAYLIRMLAGRIKDELDDEFGKTGVLSLSATWSSALMWSHYADEHRGICIEYDTRDQGHPRLAAVHYRAPRAIKTSDLVRWKVRDDEAAKGRVLETYFYAKSGEWRYEKEWRDLRDASGVTEVPFRTTAIHFGLRCDPAVTTSVVRLLSDQPQIKLWGIRPKQDTFMLRRSLIDRDEINANGIQEPSFLVFKDIFWDDDDGDGLPDEDFGGQGLAAVPGEAP